MEKKPRLKSVNSFGPYITKPYLKMCGKPMYVKRWRLIIPHVWFDHSKNFDAQILNDCPIGQASMEHLGYHLTILA
jgi:hypothetical protein